MKRLLRIEYASQEQLKKRDFSDVESVQIADNATLVDLEVNVHLRGSYFPDKSKKYSLVVLSDEELKGLEGKAK